MRRVFVFSQRSDKRSHKKSKNGLRTGGRVVEPEVTVRKIMVVGQCQNIVRLEGRCENECVSEWRHKVWAKG